MTIRRNKSKQDSARSNKDEINCYNYPQYWDLAFRSETKLEVEFFEAVAKKYCDFPVRRVLEPGCGGGRLVVEMAARGYDVSAFDLSDDCIRYLRQRLKRRGLTAQLDVGDMTAFQASKPVDMVFNTMNTFRHLTTEADARSHLKSVAASLKKGGLFVLGFHLLPPDADEEDSERWTARHGRTKVTMSLRVLNCDRKKRVETIRFNLHVKTGVAQSRRTIRLRSDYRLRIYTADQVKRLFRSVPEFELVEVFDFWYEIDHPVPLDDQLGDAVFLLRRT